MVLMEGGADRGEVWGFLYVRGGDGITTLGVLCVLLKRRTAGCQNGSFAAF